MTSDSVGSLNQRGLSVPNRRSTYARTPYTGSKMNSQTRPTPTPESTYGAKTLARASVFAPYVLSGVGVGLVWLFIFDPVYGVLAYVLRRFGTESPRWFNDPTLSLVMVIVVYVWKNLGYCAIVYLAGLQSLPADVMEAASLDGASTLRRFWHVSLPLLGPTTLFLLITTILSSLQAFDLIKIMTPTSQGTRTLIYEAYVQGFGAYQRAGYSAAILSLLHISEPTSPY